MEGLLSCRLPTLCVSRAAVLNQGLVGLQGTLAMSGSIFGGYK